MRITDAARALVGGFQLPKRMFRGRVAVMDGIPVAIGGYYPQNGCMVVFMEAKPEAKRHPVTLFRAARQMVHEAAGFGMPVICTMDEEEPNAARFLATLGFRVVATRTWAWTTQRRR